MLSLSGQNGKDERLSQEGVFCDQFGLSSGKVGQRQEQERGAVRCGPGDEAVAERPQAQMCHPCDDRENPLHRVRSPL